MFRTVFPSIVRCSRLYIQQQAYVKQILLASRNKMFHLAPASKQTAVSVWRLLLYVQSWTPDDGRKDHTKHVEWYSKWNKIWDIDAFSRFYYRNILKSVKVIFLAKILSVLTFKPIILAKAVDTVAQTE